MTPKLRDLCSIIIEDCYGDFYGLLFRRLAQHGRLSSTQLAQKCHLPLRQVRYGLAALLQLRLIQCHYSPTSDFATYQANLKAAYNLLRTGKLIDLAARTFGPDAGNVMRKATNLGFSSLAELRDRVLNDSISSKPSHHAINGTIRVLVEHAFLIRVRKVHFQPAFDIRNDVERSLRESGGFPKTMGAKAKAELESKIEVELQQRLTIETSEFGHVNPNFEQSATVNGDGQLHDDHLANGEQEDEATILCPNFGKVTSSVRSDFLRDKVEERIGRLPSLVLQSVVNQANIDNAFQLQQEELIRIDTEKLLADVNDCVTETRAQSGRRDAVRVNGNHRSSKHELSSKDLHRYMEMLTEGAFDFLSGGFAPETWTLNQHDLQNYVVQQEVLRLIESKIQHPGPRILRMLMEKGKAEEKTLQEIGLLGAKELRQSLAQLKQMGYVDLQEVPRDPQRQPNRTLFLWFHDSERTQNTILDSIYVGMTRLLQRLRREREALANTLNKIDREDVRDRVDQLLPPAELDTLHRFQRIESWFMVELSRLDDSVILLRGD